MPELPDDDPRFIEFAIHLSNMLQMYMGKPLDRFTMGQINTLIDHQSINFKQRFGFDVPKLVALVLPTSRHIHFFRADLETQQIQVVIKNLLQEFQVHKIPIDTQELATAIKLAWPQYDPGVERYIESGLIGKAFLH